MVENLTLGIIPYSLRHAFLTIDYRLRSYFGWASSGGIAIQLFRDKDTTSHVMIGAVIEGYKYKSY